MNNFVYGLSAFIGHKDTSFYVKEFSKTKVINLGSSCIYPLNAENPISEKSFMTGKLEPTNSAYAIAKITAPCHLIPKSGARAELPAIFAK